MAYVITLPSQKIELKTFKSKKDLKDDMKGSRSKEFFMEKGLRLSGKYVAVMQIKGNCGRWKDFISENAIMEFVNMGLNDIKYELKYKYGKNPCEAEKVIGVNTILGKTNSKYAVTKELYILLRQVQTKKAKDGGK